MDNSNNFVFKLNYSTYIMSKLRRFYYYRLYAKNSETQLINLEEVLLSNIISFDACEPILTNEEQVKNDFIIENLQSNFFGGQIVRSKPVDAYFTKKEDGKELTPLTENISEKVDRLGENKKDITHFIFKGNGTDIIFIVEAGYQSIGMPKIKNMFESKLLSTKDESLKSCKVFYEPISKKKAEITLNELSLRPLKKIVLSFKRNFENIPKTVKFIEDAPTGIFPEPFSVTIEIGIDHVGKKKIDILPKIGGYLSRFFGLDAIEDVSNLDFPSFLESFQIYYLDESNITCDEDILSKYLRIELELEHSTTKQKIFDELIKDFETKLDSSQTGDD